MIERSATPTATDACGPGKTETICWAFEAGLVLFEDGDAGNSISAFAHDTLGVVVNVTVSEPFSGTLPPGSRMNPSRTSTL